MKKHPLLLSFCLLAGCSSSAVDPAVPLGVVRPTIELPKVTETPEQIKAEMRKHAAFSPGFEEQRLKLLIHWEEIRQREGVEGFTTPPLQPSNDQAGCIDPATGQIAWRAMTCYNPDCPGQGKGGGPLLFCRPNKSMVLGADGKIVITREQDIAEPDKCTCPACGSGGFVAAYDPPESFIRNRQLDEEMRNIAKLYHESERTGKPVVLTGRMPNEVMRNKAELPKLYMTPQPGQAVEHGQFLIPVSRGLAAGPAK
jgi:hypothetical protein